jgi:hypothetical protein
MNHLSKRTNLLLILLVAVALFVGCKKDDDDETAAPDGYTVTSGEHTYRIPSAAVAYADSHFVRNAYLYHEWQVASNPYAVVGGTPTELTLAEWLTAPYDVRSTFLPAPFTHDVLTSDSSQYFKMIGLYFAQFGWGWADTWDGNVDAPDWTAPDSGLTADVLETLQFDGESRQFQHYRDMWVALP